MRFLAILLAAVMLILSPSSKAAELYDDQIWSFFETHCLDCHDGDAEKGGLNLLQTLDQPMTGQQAVDTWTHIYDRVDHGEMPPAKKERPATDEKQAFLDWIRPRLIAADDASSEVVHRRLNREEYQNAIHDLLGIDTELKHLLPEDQSRGGFDNNGAALAVSPELFMRYLEAARLAIDSAIVHGAQPEFESFVTGPHQTLERYLGKIFDKQGDHYFTYRRSKGAYSKIASRHNRTDHAGRYRVSFSARTLNTDKPVTFSVSSYDDDGFIETIGYFEAGAEEREIEIEVDVGKSGYVQVFTYGLPSWVNDPDIKVHAAIGYSDFTWEGPLHDTWPPQSHQQLLAGVDLSSGTSAADAQPAIERLMTKAYRRPISEDDLARPLRLIDQSLQSGRSFEQSLRAGLESILCSPHFLFLKESPNQNGNISHQEAASRLAFFLWNSIPDHALLDARSIDRTTIERLLADPKSQRFVENFTGQWLKLRDIADTTPDSKLYSEFDDPLQVSMVAEAHAFFSHLLEEDLPITHFLDSDFTMLNRRLAEHYELPEVAGFAMRPVSLPTDSVRGGVLTQAAVLKVTANGTNTSPVLRGVWVLENILGKHIPPPPPNIAGVEPDIREATTIREQLDLHRSSESCNSCHQYIDPLGFALESFDPIGGYRDRYLRFHVTNEEKGWGSVVPAKHVDASGQMSTGESFSSFIEFREWLVENADQFTYCLTERLATYALGREMGFSDRAALKAIAEKTKAEGLGLRTLIHNLISSPLFTKP